MQLYKINEELRKILEEIPDTGEIDADTSRRISDLQMDRRARLLDLACVIKSMEAEAHAITKEELKLNNRKHVLENRAEKLRALFHNHMRYDEKLSDGRIEISWRRSSRVIVDEEKLPREFFKERTDLSPMREAIGKLIREGVEIPGAELGTFQNLQIK